MLEELLETLELGEPVRARRRHAGADPQPDRAFPRRAGTRLTPCRSRSTIAPIDVAPESDGARGDPRGRPATCRRSASTTAPGAVRGLPRLPGRRRGRPGPSPACTTPCRDGMEIDTQDPTRAARRARTSSSSCSRSCPSRRPRTRSWPPWRRNSASGAHGNGRTLRWTRRPARVRHDDRHPYLVFQHELCISCGRCVRACDEVQGAFALTATGRGFSANVAAGLDAGFRESTCVSCGACADTCPTDAIIEITLLRLDEPSEESDDDRALRHRRDDDLRLLRGRLPPRGARARRARRRRSPRRSTARRTAATPASRGASRTSSRARATG